MGTLAGSDPPVPTTEGVFRTRLSSLHRLHGKRTEITPDYEVLDLRRAEKGAVSESRDSLNFRFVAGAVLVRSVKLSCLIPRPLSKSPFRLDQNGRCFQMQARPSALTLVNEI